MITFFTLFLFFDCSTLFVINEFLWKTQNLSVVSTNEKAFICVSFYTADEKLYEYETFFGGKFKNWDKLFQSGTPGQHTKNRDCLGKARTVRMFACYLFAVSLSATVIPIKFIARCCIAIHYMISNIRKRFTILCITAYWPLQWVTTKYWPTTTHTDFYGFFKWQSYLSSYPNYGDTVVPVYQYLSSN